MLNFELNAPNQLLFNPRSSAEELAELKNLQHEFENEFGKNNYFLVPSSGSSRGVDESVKLIALKIDRILNSANRVNHYLNATPQDSWGLALPQFHVAGIGVSARAYLMQSHIHKFSGRWDSFAAEIEQNDISYISLVPTQINDLIQLRCSSPKCVKKVFVGGGALAPALKSQITELGWPVVETYGMTETASMIAVREKDEDLFRPLNNVFVKSDQGGRLAVRCDSLLTAAVQRRDGKVLIDYYDDNSWFVAGDRAELIRMNSEVYLKILGRSSEYLKILGEGVSLQELRFLLNQISQAAGVSQVDYELLALENERTGHDLVLVTDQRVERVAGESLVREFNLRCRPYEKINRLITVDAIPRSDLGKVLLFDLKEKVISILNSEVNRGTIK